MSRIGILTNRFETTNRHFEYDDGLRSLEPEYDGWRKRSRIKEEFAEEHEQGRAFCSGEASCKLTEGDQLRAAAYFT